MIVDKCCYLQQNVENIIYIFYKCIIFIFYMFDKATIRDP